MLTWTGAHSSLFPRQTRLDQVLWRAAMPASIVNSRRVTCHPIDRCIAPGGDGLQRPTFAAAQMSSTVIASYPFFVMSEISASCSIARLRATRRSMGFFAMTATVSVQIDEIVR